MKMEKLLVNVSLFFSEVAFIQIFEFLAHPMDGNLMFFFQYLRRATFFSWRGCYLHGKMLYVCSQSSSHRISQESLTEKAMCISLKCFSQVLAKQHPFRSLVNYASVQFPNVGNFPVLIQEGKKVTGTSSGLYEKASTTGDLEWEPPNAWSVPQSAAPTNKESVGWTCTSLCMIRANCWRAAVCGKAPNSGC